LRAPRPAETIVRCAARGDLRLRLALPNVRGLITTDDGATIDHGTMRLHVYAGIHALVP
jgi:hypothetical protein